MANYPSAQYGPASGGAGGGGGDPVWIDVGTQGSVISILAKDVFDRDLIGGAGVILTVAPAEIARSIPGNLRYPGDPGPPPDPDVDVAVDRVLVQRAGGPDPLPDGSGDPESVPVTVDDLTQVSWTSADPCADSGGVVPLWIWALYPDGSYNRFGGDVQLVVDDIQSLCAGP